MRMGNEASDLFSKKQCADNAEWSFVMKSCVIPKDFT